MQGNSDEQQSLWPSGHQPQFGQYGSSIHQPAHIPVHHTESYHTESYHTGGGITTLNDSGLPSEGPVMGWPVVSIQSFYFLYSLIHSFHSSL